MALVQVCEIVKYFILFRCIISYNPLPIAAHTALPEEKADVATGGKGGGFGSF